MFQVSLSMRSEYAGFEKDVVEDVSKPLDAPVALKVNKKFYRIFNTFSQSGFKPCCSSSSHVKNNDYDDDNSNQTANNTTGDSTS